MRAHEWTRARQRPVRHLGGAAGRLAEDEPEAAPSPEPALLTEEVGPEPEPFAEEPDVPAEEGLRFVSAEALEEPLVEESDEGEPELAEEAPVRLVPEAAAQPVSRAQRGPARRRAAPARQAQLPLELEPELAEAARRSATETREDLIQRLLDPHLSLQETAKLLNVCPTTVRRYTNRGLLAHYRTPGNQRRFRLSDVLAFMERQGIPAHGLERKRPSVGPDDQDDES